VFWRHRQASGGTVSTWSHKWGDVLVVSVLFRGARLCFGTASPARPPGPCETSSPNLVFDYVLYLGSLTWCIELAYIENQFHLLSDNGISICGDRPASSSSSLIVSIAASSCRWRCLARRMVRVTISPLAVVPRRCVPAICNRLQLHRGIAEPVSSAAD